MLWTVLLSHWYIPLFLTNTSKSVSEKGVNVASCGASYDCASNYVFVCLQLFGYLLCYTEIFLSQFSVIGFRICTLHPRHQMQIQIAISVNFVDMKFALFPFRWCVGTFLL